MKKFLLFVFFICNLLIHWNEVYATWITNTQTWLAIRVTEKVPWWNCVEETSTTWSGFYVCTIQPWLQSVQEILSSIIKWLTALAALSWVLFIVINGIMLSAGWDNIDETKKRIVKGLIGIILVLMSGVILNIIAPWIYK